MAKAVGVYISVRSEVSTADIIKQALAEGKKLRAPKVLSDTKMRFFEIANCKNVKRGKFGIPEPKPACKKVGCSTMDLILVPGIVFDKKGYRLGHGLGFYDRFLPRAFRSVKVGLTFAKTLVSSIPHDRKDVPVDIIITENGIYRT